MTSALDKKISRLYSPRIKQACLYDKETRPVKPNEPQSNLCSNPERDRRNLRRFTLWSFLWALSFVLSTLGIKKEWWPPAGEFVAVASTALLGLVSILRYRRFLMEADELQRKIEIEALALAFGVGMVGGLSSWLLVVGASVPGTDLIYVFCAMMVTYAVSVLVGRRRYS